MLHLARRGQRVLGIDRFAPPHSRGSSHGQTRVIRQAYFEHPDYVPLVRRAYDLWRDLEGETGQRLFVQCGLLEAGPAEGVVVPGVLKAAQQHDLEVESLSPDEVTRRWPDLRVPEELAVVYEPAAGYLMVEECVAAHLELGRRRGAELLTDCIVKGWREDPQGVTVETSRGTFSSGKLVITAGAWAGGLLDDPRVSLTPLRKALFWYPAGKLAAGRELPTYLFEREGLVHYGFPSLDGATIKVAEHSGGTILSDPRLADQAIDPSEQARLEDFLKDCLPAVTGSPVDHTTCLYTVTPDHHFVVDRHPQFERVIYAAGLSGHGFKFATVLGEILAELACNRTTPHPIDFLSANRFAC